MENMTTELVALLMAAAIYLVRQWLAGKNADLDKKATQIQNIILGAITKARAVGWDKDERESMGKAALKQIAVDAITKEI